MLTMLDALKQVYEKPQEYGARPISWKGTASCIVWADLKEDGQVWIVRTIEGVQISPIPGPEIFEEWELVTQDILVQEQSPFQEQIDQLNKQFLESQTTSVSGSST